MKEIFSENFKHRLNIASIIFAITLAPLAVLILVSQNTVPGDFFYPVKRSMENVVLAAAVVHPSTRIAFRSDLTDRRFDEAEMLLVDNQDIEGLREFVKEIKTTHAELSAIDNKADKENLQKKFTDSMDAYGQKLQIVQSKLDAKGESSPVALVSAASQSAPQSFPTPVIVVSTYTPMPTNTPVPIPTTRPGFSPRPTNTPVPLATEIPKVPTATPIKLELTPTTIPIPTNTSFPRSTGFQGRGVEPTNTPVPLPTATPIQSESTPKPVHSDISPSVSMTGGQPESVPVPVCGVQDILLSTPSMTAFVACMGKLCPFESENNCDSLNPIKSHNNNPRKFLNESTAMPDSFKEKNKEGKVKGATDVKINDPFIEILNLLITPFVIK